MPKQQRWLLLVAAVVTALVLCAVPLMLSHGNEDATNNNGSEGQSTGRLVVGGDGTGVSSADANGGGAGAGSNEANGDGNPASGRPACPVAAGPAAASSSSPLAGVHIPCLGNTTADAASHSLAENLAGKPTIINVWAYWCQPCRAEIPIVAATARAHPEWNVVGVHEDPTGDAGVKVLSDLKVDGFISYQDSTKSVSQALGLPAVIPITIVLRADGTVAATHAQTFRSQEELEEAVTSAL